MRILHAPSNIANQSWLMAEGLRAQGHEVQVWQYGEPNYGFQVDRVLRPGTDPKAYVHAFVEAMAQDFDIVHFHYGRSLIPARGHLPWYWDLPVWRALGKKVVFTFHGSDVRRRSHHVADDEWSFYRFAEIPCDEERIESQLRIIRNYADLMTVVSVLDQPYVPDAVYLPKLVDVRKIAYVGPVRRERPVIFHAPSRRATKGTDFVLEALDRLRETGAEFDVDLVEGVSHAELLTRSARADIVVEKLLGGDAGVSSLEAMAQGKVAVARIRAEVRDEHPGMPVVNADPRSFVDRLVAVLASPELRADVGQQGRAYVEQHHDCRVIGARLADLYQRAARPTSVVYPGWTVPEPQRRVELWQQRVQRTEETAAALRLRIERLKARVALLEARLEPTSREALARAAAPDEADESASTPPEAS
jgi:glycosyltransferase involved in cell wall biosynthesis